MKRTPLSVLMMLCLSWPAFAQTARVPFSWNAPATQPSGAEMRLTSTNTPPLSPITFDCGATPLNTCTVLNVPPGSWSATAFFYQLGIPTSIRSYSVASNAVTFTIPAQPPPPANLTFGQIIIASLGQTKATLLADTSVSAATKLVISQQGGTASTMDVDNGGTSHTMALKQLRPHTVYEYHWVAESPDGQKITSRTYTFTTGQ